MILIVQGKTNWKYLLIVVILAAIVGGGILWLMGQEKTKDETADLSSKALATEDWKIYRNEEYGFEFEYPENYDKHENCTVNVDEERNSIHVGLRIDIAIEDSRGLSLSGYVDQDFIQNGLEEVWRGEITIGGRRAIGISYQTIGFGRFGELAYVLKDGKIYEFSWLAGADCGMAIGGPSEPEVYGHILSTFRFLE